MKNTCKCGGLKDKRAEMCGDCRRQDHQGLTNKICTKCDADLPIEQFRLRKKRGEMKRVSICLTCESRDTSNRHKSDRAKVNQRKREYYSKFPDKHRLERLRAAWKKRGYDPLVVQEFFMTHDDRCDICGLSAKEIGHSNLNLSIDHDHTTGRIRGMLCSHCNAGLGLFRDSPELLTKAVEYLRSDKIQIYPT